jgi:hypothetical protein
MCYPLESVKVGKNNEIQACASDMVEYAIVEMFVALCSDVVTQSAYSAGVPIESLPVD